MPIYSFRIKKDKYQLELSTSDRELLAEQFELWVNSAGAYAKNIKAKQCKEIVNTRIRAEEEITKKNIETQIARYPISEPEDIIVDKDVCEKTSYDGLNSKKDIDALYSQSSLQQSEITNKSNSDNAVFDSILEHSLHNPKTEMSFKPAPSIKKDSAFLNYISTRKIERKIDYLLLTAYYFTQYEQKPRFTLKQLNAKLMQNIAVIIDHSVLQEAINRDYIECLPDLTGLVGASEYRLTAYGEKVLLDE